MRIHIITVLLLLCSCQQTIDDSNTRNEPVTNEQTMIELETPVQPEQLEISEESDEVVAEISTSNEYIDKDWEAYEATITKDFSFVILISTNDYQAALRRAKDASEKLGYPMDLRDLHENEEIGLSLPKRVCEEEICGGGLDYPMYLPRNDWGESKYVSIEYSDGFKGFTKGYYIVVVASAEKGAPIIQEALIESRKFYKDAYAKSCGVWMGCGC